MSKYVYLIDPGHGGLIDGRYVTPGKRSPKFEDGTQLFEGVNNRLLAKKLMQKLDAHDIEYIDVTAGSNEDIPLTTRVKRANAEHKRKKCVYISLHSDAAGDGINWHSASGISVYTSVGQTKSDIFASLVIHKLHKEFETSVKWREDNADGDPDKEAHFYVLRETNCPAILCELGFHTNYEECKRIKTDKFKDSVVEALYEAILQWEKL